MGRFYNLKGLDLGFGSDDVLQFSIAPALQLSGVRSFGASSLSVSLLSLAGIAAVAAYLPTRRAFRVDPTTALRYE